MIAFSHDVLVVLVFPIILSFLLGFILFSYCFPTRPSTEKLLVRAYGGVRGARGLLGGVVGGGWGREFQERNIG